MSVSAMRVASLPSVASTSDVFSHKVGEWAFAQQKSTTHNECEDIPHGFAGQAQDGVVMDYLDEFIADKRLPVAHLFSQSLEALTAKVEDPTVRALLEADCQLHAYLKARRIGDVYE